MNIRFTSTILTLLIAIFSGYALTVDNLTINTLKNPSGIDDAAPRFGWQLKSNKRGVKQQDYAITIYGDADCTRQIWTSGTVTSDASQSVSPHGLTLEPCTRYYWRVAVTDNQGESATSCETAYFDTGLMGDWSGAKWIRDTDNTYGFYIYTNIKDYSIEADIEIIDNAAAICFSKGDSNYFRMWKVDMSKPKAVKLKCLDWKKGVPYSMGEALIGDKVQIQKGKPFHIKIDITGDGKLCTTYIDGVKINAIAATYSYTQIGIGQGFTESGSKETALYDNIKVTDTQNGKTVFYEDFTRSNNFSGGEIVNGRLRVDGTKDHLKYLWQNNGRVTYQVSADMTIVSGAPALIFGWTADRAYFMWQIITDHGTKPLLRRNVRTFSDEIWSEDVILSNYSNSDFIGKEHRLTVRAQDYTIITSIDGIDVDTLVFRTRRVPMGKVGFRVDKATGSSKDEGYFDNLVFTVNYPNGHSATLVNENFDGAVSDYFLDSPLSTVNGNKKCHLVSGDTEYKHLQIINEVPTYYSYFHIDKAVAKAQLYTSALGVYDLNINGRRVGHRNADGTTVYDEMKPGWTDYNKRVFYNSHDVTALCQSGDNIIGATVTPGWVTGVISRMNYSSLSNGLIAKLVITYTDGTRDIITTDESWRCTKAGALMSSDIYNGERYDARRQYPWDGEMGLYPCTVEAFNYVGIIESAKGPAVRALTNASLLPLQTTIYQGVVPGSDYGMIKIVDTADSGKAFRLRKGQTAVIDFGQNMAGVPDFEVKGPSGTMVHLRFAEMLNDTGEKSRGNDGPGGSIYTANLRVAKAEIHYILRGGTETDKYSPTTTFYGYRYCELTASDDIEVLEIKALPWSSSYDDRGTVTTDNDYVNRLFSNIVWGQRSNLLSVPTDCPQRDERLGWSADTQIFSNTGMYNANTPEFYRKWLTDMRDGQRADGAYCDVAPKSLRHFGNGAWSDAGIIVTWHVYLMTGNTDVIVENYDAMSRYMDWLATNTDGKIKHPGGGTEFGDWLAFAETDSRYVSQAYYAYDAQLMSKMARLLSQADGDDFDKASKRYDTLFAVIREEMQQLYFNDQGLQAPTQTACILALHFNLCSDDRQAEKTAEQLSRLIIDNGNRLSTGFVGTAYINTALSEAGLADIAYNLLLQRDFPSWLYSVDQGATTMWERWDSYTQETGFGKEGMNSFNHYAYGAVGEWMYRDMAGIKIDELTPGFKKTIFEPYMDMRQHLPAGQQAIKHAKAEFLSPYGMVLSEWTITDDETYTYKVTVPANTEAEVHLPIYLDNTKIYENKIPIDKSADCKLLRQSDDRRVYTVNSGEYTFTVLGDNNLTIDPIKDGGKIVAYPNPTRGILYLHLNEPIESLVFTDINGRTVKTDDDPYYIQDISHLNAGVYILTIYTDNGTYMTKVIKF